MRAHNGLVEQLLVLRNVQQEAATDRPFTEWIRGRIDNVPIYDECRRAAAVEIHALVNA